VVEDELDQFGLLNGTVNRALLASTGLTFGTGIAGLG
jgi:hypothetical protein